MKNNHIKHNPQFHKALNITILVAFAAVIMSSCASDPNNHSGLNRVRDFFFRPTTTAGAQVTNIVPQYASSDIVKAAVTNQTTGQITAPTVVAGAVPTNIVQVVVQLPPTTHWDTGESLQATQAAAGVIPGWGTIAALGVGLLGTIGKAFLNKKEANGYATVATSSFQAIEDFTNGAAASGDPKAIALATKLKQMLAQAHDYADVMPLVTQILNKSTGFSGNVASVASIASAPQAPGFDVQKVGT